MSTRSPAAQRSEYRPACRYSDIVFDTATPGKVASSCQVFTFTKKGDVLSRLSVLFGQRWHIAVATDTSRSISDATERLKEQIESVLFDTREPVSFRLEMQITTPPGQGAEIARRHFHTDKSPELVFYETFGREFIALAQRNRELTFKDGLHNNKRTWEGELAEKLMTRFGVQVRLNFILDSRISEDARISAPQGNPLAVRFKDRPDTTFPLLVDIRMKRLTGQNPVMDMPLNEQDRDDLILSIVRNCCQQELMLYDYWYRHGAMQATIEAALNRELASRAHVITNLLAVPAASATPPPLDSYPVSQQFPWADANGNTVTFRVQGNARVSADGAGIYDRAKRPDPVEKVKDAIKSSLDEVLYGVSINHFDKNQTADCEAKLKERVAEKVQAVGLNFDISFGWLLLPLDDWTRSRTVHIAAANYRTSAPDIEGEFSMDVQVRFLSRRALDTIFVRHAQSGTLQTNSVPDDAFVEKQIVERATEAARLVLQSTPADAYFSENIGAASWDSATQPPQDEERKNLIEARLRTILDNSFPELELERLEFHRRDSSLATLHRAVSALRFIEFPVTIKDRLSGNADKDRTVRATVVTDGGDAAKVVMMLANELHLKPESEIRSQIVRRLQTLLTDRLAMASGAEIDALTRSLTQMGKTFTSPMVMAVEEDMKRLLLEEFGLVANTVNLSPEISQGEELLRDFSRQSTRLPLQADTVEQSSILVELTSLLEQRQKITGTATDDMTKRERLTARIDQLRQEMRRMNANASPTGNMSLAQHIQDAQSSYLHNPPPLPLPAQPSGQPQERPAPEDEGGW